MKNKETERLRAERDATVRVCSLLYELFRLELGWDHRRVNEELLRLRAQGVTPAQAARHFITDAINQKGDYQ